MAIKPFNDRPKVDIGARRYSKTASESPSTMASSDSFPLAQGVSLKRFVDTKCKLLPFLSTNGYPQGESDIIDHQIKQTSYGMHSELIEGDPFETGGALPPFEDISDLRDPVKFLKDSGITAYPNIMLNPNYRDPGMMNGVIEPFTLRGTLPGFSIESPFIIKSLKADLMPEEEISHFVASHAAASPSVPFIDSSDVVTLDSDSSLGLTGISDFGTAAIVFFDDSLSKNTVENDLVSMHESDFSDFTGVGIVSKMVMGTMFDFEPVKNVIRGETGIRNSTGVESVAFGGLTK